MCYTYSGPLDCSSGYAFAFLGFVGEEISLIDELQQSFKLPLSKLALSVNSTQQAHPETQDVNIEQLFELIYTDSVGPSALGGSRYMKKMH